MSEYVKYGTYDYTNIANAFGSFSGAFQNTGELALFTQLSQLFEQQTGIVTKITINK